MTDTFITKYKPYYIRDFLLKDDFLQVLKTLFEIDDLNLIFYGYPNSGKTTFLYAIIREYYQLNRNDSIPESNILFINNLKEQGIQFYRTEMKSFCRSRCSIHNKKKLVIIDDIDTINEQSQQVFRNYIDKYKHNVNFIAVCSNIQKIIESIQSRLHILQIPAINREQITNIMKRIITEENLIIDQESKDYLIKNSGNSIRNIINNLEKIFILNGAKDANSIRSNGGILLNDNEAKLGEPVDIHSCRKLCSNISMTHFENFINMILNGKIHDAIENIFGIFDYGYSVIDILDYFFYFVKMTDLLTEEQKYLVLPIICNYTTIFHNIHEDSIELVLFTNELSKILVSSPS